MALFSLSPALSATPAPCLAGMRKALVEGRFTGPLVCSQENATFVLAGRTTGDKFSVYDYRYRFRPPAGNVMHGGQKVVVFQGARYIGQYALSPPPYATVSVSGAEVVLKYEDGKGNASLEFSRQPPKKVLVNGEVAVFLR